MRSARHGTAQHSSAHVHPSTQKTHLLRAGRPNTNESPLDARRGGGSRTCEAGAECRSCRQAAGASTASACA
jgi:hypothetical protein